MGVHGMDARSGFTTPNMLEAETDRALIEAGRRLVVVADHTKWGVIGISSIARLDQADVADHRPRPRARRSASAQLARRRRLIVAVEPATRRASRRGRAERPARRTDAEPP